LIEAFGKNEQVKKMFWTLLFSMAGLVLALVVDPVTAQRIVGLITGMGGIRGYPSSLFIFWGISMAFKNLYIVNAQTLTYVPASER